MANKRKGGKMFAKERPNFGPLQIRTPEEIKKGMILAEYEKFRDYLRFMRVVDPPCEDQFTAILCVKVEYEYARAGAFHSGVNRGVTTKTLDLSSYGVVPYKDGTWCEDRCFVRVDQNSCIPDELLPKNYTPEAEERRKAQASGKYSRKCKRWHHTITPHRSTMLEFAFDFGKCDIEGKPRRCGQIYAGDCPDYEEKIDTGS